MNALSPPPHSAQAEQAVLGGLLINPQSLPFVRDLLGQDDFYRREHRLIFAAIEATAQYSDVDVITVSERLEADGTIDDVGALPYLGELHSTTPSAKHIASYARVVANHARARRLVALSHDMLAATGDDWQEVADHIMCELLAMSGVQRHWECELSEALRSAVDVVERAFQAQGLVGIPTGLTKLDKVLGGLHDTDLVVIGARPAMGKTALALRFALSADCPVGIISTEQPRDQLALRMAAMEAGIDASRLRNGQLDDDEWPRLTAAMSVLSHRPIHINDQPGISIAQIRRQARTWKQQQQIRALYVDYLQNITPGRKDASKTESIGEIAKGLKDIARELHIPVVALAQVKRDVESRQDKRPRMGDLYHSSEIEMVADQVVLLYRPEVYEARTEHAGMAELLIDKNRHGPTGYVRVAFVASCMRFEDLPQDGWRGSASAA